MGTHFVRDGHEYGREACFLAARKRQALPATADEAPFTLTEALVAAFDAREHETGVHSKRVACHTLVLAKHFTTEPQRLRQTYHGALLHDIGKNGIPDTLDVFVDEETTLRNMVELKCGGATLGGPLTSNEQTEQPRGISKGER